MKTIKPKQAYYAWICSDASLWRGKGYKGVCNYVICGVYSTRKEAEEAMKADPDLVTCPCAHYVKKGIVTFAWK